jgi:5'-methylthioadenosine phosphorylase
MYRGFGAHVIGMTNLPEAKLAREAELPYASLAMATDYDCWHQSEEVVTVEAVIAVLHKNVDLAKNTLRALVKRLPNAAESPASRALQNAIITSPAHISTETRQLLAPLLKKYYPAE